MKRMVKMGWIVFAVICICPTLLAQTAAKVISTSGRVTAIRSGQLTVLKRGSVLLVGDVISTEGTAVARLRYNNGSLVRLSNTANYKILKFAPKKEVEIEASLNRGKARIVTPGRKTKKEILKTKVVAMAIIGTDVTADTGNGSSLIITLRQGMVSIAGRRLLPGVYNVHYGNRNNLIISSPNIQATLQDTDIDNLGQLISVTNTLLPVEATVTNTPIVILDVICPIPT